MVFSSIAFLLYFLPVFLIIYFLADQKYKNIILLLFSIIFYSWAAPKFVFIILGTTFIDFHIIRKMDISQNRLKRKLFLALSLTLNLGLLIYFKYSNFFIENINQILSVFDSKDILLLNIILPVGISFYTFEMITYSIEIYRKNKKSLSRFWDYQTYILMFPKITAGPIAGYKNIADQIVNRKQNDTIDNKLTGFYRFSAGLAKKVILANQMNIYCDQFFSQNITQLDSYSAWLGLLCFSFQIYFDFSGYSDMAIGLGKMLGFRFIENFDNPYISKSVTEFWKRWHISLSFWLRNYIFLPLAYSLSRKLKKDRYWNVRTDKVIYIYAVLITFILCGFWHGATWSFILWGAYQSLFLIIERLFLLRFYKKTGKYTGLFFTFLFISIGWVFFKTENASDAFLYIQRLFAFESGYKIQQDTEFYSFFILGIFFSFFALINPLKKIQDMFYSDHYSLPKHVIVFIFSIVLLAISISSITTTGFNPFIYFRF